MEIYKDLSSPISQQFEKLLNNQLSKNKIAVDNPNYSTYKKLLD